MTRPRVVAVGLLALSLTASAGGLVGCGGGGSPQATSGSQAAAVAAGRAYAARVAAVTQQTGARLAQIAASSNYDSASAAQASTKAYATAIRAAADQLSKARPVKFVATQHAALVALYRTTADRMDALAAKFATAGDVGALATQAQAFSAEVQRYSTTEQQLRAQIEQGLAAQASPPAIGTGPGVQGTSDPG